MRLLNRPLALLLAAALATAGVFVIIEVIAAAVHATPVVFRWPSWVQWAHRTRWNDAVVKVWSIVLGVIGVLLLVAELLPARRSRIPLRSEDPATDTAITRKGLAGVAGGAASDVDGVAHASAAVAGRTVTVRAAAAAVDPSAAHALTEPVRAAVQTRLDTLGLRRSPRLRVHVTSRSR